MEAGGDGWRGRVGDDLSVQTVVRICVAVASEASSRGATDALVAYADRPHARRLAAAACLAVASVGMPVRLAARPCSMAAVACEVARRDDADGATDGAPDGAWTVGIMVTAGHYGTDWNGVKVRLGDGGPAPADFLYDVDARAMTLSDDEVAAVMREMPGEGAGVVAEAGGDSGAGSGVASLDDADWDACDGASWRVAAGATPADPSATHAARLRACVDVDAIRAVGLTAVCDVFLGGSPHMAADLLESVGVRAIQTARRVDGPGATAYATMGAAAVEACAGLVVSRGASLGILSAADGTRVALVDKAGDVVPSGVVASLVLRLLCEYRLQTGAVVMTSPTSRVVRRQAERLGCPISVVPVGYAHLAAETRAGLVLLGVQETGGIVVPSVSLERDALLAALLVCELMARRGMSLRELVAEVVDEVGGSEYGRRDVELDAGTIQIVRNMLPGINPAELAGLQPTRVDHTDGLLLEFADGAWVQVRPSSSEPRVRVYAEAPERDELDRLLAGACAMLRTQFA